MAISKTEPVGRAYEATGGTLEGMIIEVGGYDENTDKYDCRRVLPNAEHPKRTEQSGEQLRRWIQKGELVRKEG